MNKTAVLTVAASFMLLLALAPACAAEVYIGKGCTTAWHIDKDCDGYGVGPVEGKSGAALPPDADDNDPGVNTAESMLAEYGTLENFLLQAKGYNPQRIFFVSPTGNDSTAEIGNPDRPFGRPSTVIGQLRAGDMMMLRQGNYDTSALSMYMPDLHGTETDPVIIMAYPGERPIVRGPNAQMQLFDSNYVVVDGMKSENVQFKGGSIIPPNWQTLDPEDIKNHMKPFSHITIRNYWGESGRPMLAYLMQHVLIEDSISHQPGSGASHAIYLSSEHQFPNSDITIRGCIFSGNGGNAGTIQQNGPVDGLVIEDCIIHSGISSISLLRGAKNITIRNNALFPDSFYGIILRFYGGTGTWVTTELINQGAYDDVNVTIEHNTIYTQRSLALTNDNWPNGVNMEDIFVKNNILVSNSGPDDAILRAYPDQYLSEVSMQNNVLYRIGGMTGIIAKNWETADYTMDDAPGILHSFQNNTLADPKLTNASMSYLYGSPQLFNFELLANSPAIEFGSSTGAPAVDIKGRERTGLPDAGAYEYYTPEFAITSPATLPNATKDSQYNYTLQAQNGNTPYTWSSETGTPPTGLQLTSTGTITGTPTTTETKTFTIKVTDSTQQQRTKQFTLEVAEGPYCGNGTPETGENCTNCPQDITCPTGQQCQNGQCTTPQECITMTVLMNYINQWKNGQINMTTLMEKITKWKIGEGCT